MGGPGDDVLLGRGGDDSYIFWRGDGRDRIKDDVGDHDVVLLRGYAPEEVELRRAPADALDLVLTFTGSPDELVLVNALGHGTTGVEEIVFDDGTVWTMDAVRLRLLDEANDAEDRVIHGYSSDDILSGGAGDDELHGGDGADIYHFGRGDGQDIIEDDGDNAYDRLVVTGFRPDEVGLSRWYKGDDGLLLSFAGTNDSVLLRNGMADTGDRIEEISFEDGTLWTIEYVSTLLENTGPVARADSYFSASPGVGAPIEARRLLQNDFDADGDVLKLVGVKNADVGQVSLAQDGGVIYTAPENYTGIAQFTYVVADGKGGLAEARAYVRVEAQPEARDDLGFETQEDVSLVLSQQTLLANDRDGDLLTLSDVTSAVNGIVTLRTDGTISFQPDADFHGTAQFDYHVFGPDGGAGRATVEIEVLPVNDAPQAGGDTGISLIEDGSLTLISTVLLANDQDADGDPLSIVSVDNAVGGTAVLTAEGDVIFTAAADFTGEAGFDYTVSDTTDATSSAHVSISVTSVNDAPQAVDDIGLAADEDVTQVIDKSLLLANDTDVDGDELIITRVFDAENAIVELLANGNIEFKGRPDFFGTASFGYEISDGSSGPDALSTAQAFVTVAPVNDAPVVASYLQVLNGAFELAEDDVFAISVDSLLGAASDADGDPLSLLSVTSAANGEVVLGQDGIIRFTPDEDFSGLAAFRYLVSDGNGGLATGRVEMNVLPVNDAPPDAQPDFLFALEDTTLVIDPAELLANDSDIDGDTLEIVSVVLTGEDSAGAQVALGEDGLIRFTPAADFAGRTGFAYDVSDGSESDSAIVDVDVRPVNDAPEARDDTGFASPLGVPVVIAISDLLPSAPDNIAVTVRKTTSSSS